MCLNVSEVCRVSYLATFGEKNPGKSYRKKLQGVASTPLGGGGLSYKTQWRSQEVEIEGQNILSSLPLLMEMNKQQTYWGELRVKPKRRARSARDLRSKPESKAKPEIERGGVWGEGSVSHSPENF